MKALALFLFSMSATTTVFAADLQCPSEIAEIVNAVDNSKSCLEAEQITNTCRVNAFAYGEVISSASSRCLEEVGPALKADETLLETMQTRCDEVFDAQEGSIARIEKAYCRFNAIVWINKLHTSAN